MRFIRFVWLPLLLLFVVGCGEPTVTAYTSADCGGCHQIQQSEWTGSHHARAMTEPAPSTVKGRFGNRTTPVSAQHMGLAADFFQEPQGDRTTYLVRLRRGDQVEQYAIAYTFGFYPLQQYLIAGERGKFQVFPFAWDDRPEAEGGQRWFTQYPDEDIRTDDRLHWQQPLQTWNGMCADCHSDGLKRNYDLKSDSFATTFKSINVDCLSCHDDKSRPHQEAPTAAVAASGGWHREVGQSTAHWQGPDRDNRFMDTCFACHSLRSPLTDGFSSDRAYLDQFKPNQQQTPGYYPVSQIREEVYVYGSFLQSRMFANGVNCLDCHNPHSLKLNVEGNGLCTKCHGPEVFDTVDHHGHAAASSGSQCTSCHMPQRNFMVVDERADHRFNVPRPDWTGEYGVPNACNQCHTDESPEWAATAWNRWHGGFKPRPAERAYLELQSGKAVTLQQHLATINDKSLPVIKRATALALLANRNDNPAPSQLSAYVSHENPLLRYAAAMAAARLDPRQKSELLLPLLTDPVAAVRLEAVTQLLGSPVPAEKRTLFETEVARLFAVNDQAGWRAEGRLNNGLFAAQLGRLADAERYYQGAIGIEPYFPAAYVNLADLYRATGEPKKEEDLYRQALQKLPGSALLRYAHGLFLVRKSSYELAATELAQAHELEPANPQFTYAYALVLDRNGRLGDAIAVLHKALKDPAQEQTLLPLYQQLSAKCSQQPDCH